MGREAYAHLGFDSIRSKPIPNPIKDVPTMRSDFLAWMSTQVPCGVSSVLGWTRTIVALATGRAYRRLRCDKRARRRWRRG